MAYTPGLKVKKAYRVRKLRRLPAYGDVLVKEGDQVSPENVIARTSIPGDVELIMVCYDLGVQPDEIEPFMLKKEGDPIKKGEVLARNRAWFGLVNRECICQFDGTVEMVSTASGRVLIRSSPIPVEVKAYIQGKVVKVIPKEGAEVETIGAYIQGIFGFGGETSGELCMIAKSPEEPLDKDQITSEHKGKIIVGGSIVTSEALKQAVEVGVKGIVVGGIESRDLTQFLGYDIGVAITGQEEVGLTLVITEGFSTMKMAKRTFEILKTHNGHLASINGATQIRAGVIRPEIIIPLNTVEERTAQILADEELDKGLESGTPIRIIREPYFGAIGRVSNLPVELQKIETESDVRVLEAELEDGRKVIIPRANVELVVE